MPKKSNKRNNDKKLEILKMRLHIVEALLIACQNKHDVKKLIRSKYPKEKLINHFSFTKDQAQAIIDLKIPINKVEQAKIVAEIESLKTELQRRIKI